MDTKIEQTVNRAAVTVHVVDDEAAVLDALQLLLHSVGLAARTYQTAQAFLDGYDPEVPGCLVLDVRLPDMSGLELQEKLLKAHRDLPVILITANANVAMAVRGMRSGAVDFLEKPFNPQVLLERIEHALHGDARARAVREGRDADAARMARLTRREAQVVQLVTAGRANKEIARELGVAQKTVELHRSKAMKKLGATHVAEMVALALRCRQA